MNKYKEQLDGHIHQYHMECGHLKELHSNRVKHLKDYTMEDLELDYQIKHFQYQIKKLELLILEFKYKNAQFLINIKKDEKGVNNND